jgi:hypothetical protein
MQAKARRQVPPQTAWETVRFIVVATPEGVTFGRLEIPAIRPSRAAANRRGVKSEA